MHTSSIELVHVSELLMLLPWKIIEFSVEEKKNRAREKITLKTKLDDDNTVSRINHGTATRMVDDEQWQRGKNEISCKYCCFRLESIMKIVCLCSFYMLNSFYFPFCQLQSRWKSLSNFVAISVISFSWISSLSRSHTNTYSEHFSAKRLMSVSHHFASRTRCDMTPTKSNWCICDSWLCQMLMSIEATSHLMRNLWHLHIDDEAIDRQLSSVARRQFRFLFSVYFVINVIANINYRQIQFIFEHEKCDFPQICVCLFLCCSSSTHTSTQFIVPSMCGRHRRRLRSWKVVCLHLPTIKFRSTNLLLVGRIFIRESEWKRTST